MADMVAQQEDAEMEALLSMMEGEKPESGLAEYEAPETPYGSDDEEYDHLFMDVIREEESKPDVPACSNVATEQPDEEMMDMS